MRALPFAFISDYNDRNNFVVALRGKKHVLLFPPSDAPYLYLRELGLTFVMPLGGLFVVVILLIATFEMSACHVNLIQLTSPYLTTVCRYTAGTVNTVLPNGRVLFHAVHQKYFLRGIWGESGAHFLCFNFCNSDLLLIFQQS